ncbi:MAG TPA: DUF2336 domain-containing protein [Roseiarcus sp.]|nr:DUF2336 domain-containing protein [Roseiarcus sp.]
MKLFVAKKAAGEPEGSGEPTIVRRLLAWAQRAEARERAEAANVLARAFRYSDMPAPLRREAVIGLTAMLDDSSVLVRRALAEALASAHDAPHHIISALAVDLPEIAAIVVALSPVLSEAELVDCAAIGDESVQVALARRPHLGPAVAAALAEIGGRQAIIALLANADARLTPGALRRIVERFGEDGEAREALLSRPLLPATLRCDLVASAAKALSPFAAAFGLGAERIDRMMREGREDGAISIAAISEGEDLADLVRHLRASGALTGAILMRALIYGNRRFFSAAAAELSGLAIGRAVGFAREPFGWGFAALFHKMGLPAHFLTPFRVALATLEELGCEGADRPLGAVIDRVIGACEAANSADLARLLAVLRRLEAEAAVDQARVYAERAAAESIAPEIHAAESWLAPPVLVEPDDRIGAPDVVSDSPDPWVQAMLAVEAELARGEIEIIPPDAAAEATALSAKPVFDPFKALDEEFSKAPLSLERFAA